MYVYPLHVCARLSSSRKECVVSADEVFLFCFVRVPGGREARTDFDESRWFHVVTDLQASSMLLVFEQGFRSVINVRALSSSVFQSSMLIHLNSVRMGFLSRIYLFVALYLSIGSILRVKELFRNNRAI